LRACLPVGRGKGDVNNEEYQYCQL
jgi:hypothetical protein